VADTQAELSLFLNHVNAEIKKGTTATGARNEKMDSTMPISGVIKCPMSQNHN
jgi:hypothetical protein